MKLAPLALLLAALLPAAPVHADHYESVDHLLAMNLEVLMATEVSISTSTKQKLSKAPAVVSLITAEDIKATGSTNLVEILQSVPGIYIRTNQFGYRPLISMRGATAPHTLVMINGSPIKDLSWSSGIFWKGLPTSMIERVEIIRGPGSALFGSDASSGAINIITKTAGKIESTEAGLRMGSHDSQTAWLQHGSQWNGLDIGVTVDVAHTDGFSPLFASDAQTARGDISFAPGRAPMGWDNQDIRLSVGKGNWRLMADYMQHSNLQTGMAGAGVIDPRTQAGDTNASIALLYSNERFTQDWGLNAELRYRDVESSSGDGFLERPPGYVCTAAGVRRCPAGVSPGTYRAGLLNIQRAAEKRLNAEFSGVYSGFQSHAIRIGAGHVLEEPYQIRHLVNYGMTDNGALPANGPLVDISGSSFAFSPKTARKNSYAFLQDVWHFADDWELTAGARYDDYSDFGHALTPRLALVWQTTERLTSKLMYGEAFRAPSYLELYARTSTTQPNTALKAEASSTWDLAFSYLVSKDLRLGLNFYEFSIGNIISVNSGQYLNGGTHVVRGIEMEAQWTPMENLTIAGNVSHRKQDYSALTSYGIPDDEAYLRVDWAFMPKWRLNIQTNWTGNRTLADGDTRQSPGSHALTDSTIRYLPDRHWELAVSMRNLFDVDAREYTGTRSLTNFLPLPGRTVYAELRYTF